MIARKLVRLLLTLGVSIITLISVSQLVVQQAFASGTTYYVNNQSGSNCSDSGAGTSQSAPWCDFTPVNSHTFGAGDQLLLAAGASWDQQMTITGSGSSSAYATLSSYGTGPNPKIIRDGNVSDRAIIMSDPSYWNVSNLEIGNAGSGIVAYYDSAGHQGLNFSNIYVHNISGIIGGVPAGGSGDANCSTTGGIWTSAGIAITGPTSLNISAPQYAVSGVSFNYITGDHNFDTVSLDWCTGQFFANSPPSDLYNYTQNVVLDHINARDDNGNGIANTCSEGLRIDSAENVTILDSRLYHEAACHVDSGTIGIILVEVENINLINNIIANVPNTSSTDQGAIDNEVFTDNVHALNNYIAGNAGPGIEYLAFRCGINDHDTNQEASGNVLSNNATALSSSYYGGFFVGGNCITPTGTIHDNLVYEPSGLTYNANFSGFTFTNNLSIPLSANIANAANDYSSVQGAGGWSYQYSNDGSSWSNLTYDSSSNIWKTSGGAIPQITQFDEHPASCTSCWVARTWTAPAGGTISIRGRVLKSDTGGGDGIIAQITRNGSAIFGPQTIAYNDQSGVNTNQDGLTVNAGDVIRFEVNENGNSNYDTTSWDPSIAYTSGDGLSSSINNASFETPNEGNSFQYSPSGASWTFGTNGSGGAGISGNGSGFTSNNPNAPNGSQVAFLQQQGTISQSINLQAGTTYQITFDADQRNGNNQENFQVLLDSNSLGTFQPTSGVYSDFATSTFTVSTTGAHTLEFVGLNSAGGDNTALIDNVRLATPANVTTTAFNRYYNGGANDHWETTGSAPSGYNLESTLGYLYSAPLNNTVQLFGCQNASTGNHFIATQANCQGQTVLGAQGWVYSTPPGGIPTTALYSCVQGNDFFVSPQSNCEGQTLVGLLGFIRNNA